MREPRTAERFASENRKLEQQTLAAAAASMYSGTAAAGPHVPTPLDDAHRAVELERVRVEHRPSGRRNDPPAELAALPTWREVEASRRWGPPASLPTTSPIVQVTREQLETEILDINAQLSSRHLMDKDLIAKRDHLVAQFNALPKKQHTSARGGE